ncbi:MAG: chitobiase/beta-hexosaminidase C-terminal domain-containing protein [Fibrobacteria bacterium]
MHRYAPVNLSLPHLDSPAEFRRIQRRTRAWGNLTVTLACLAGAFGWLGASGAQAQTKRCDLEGRDTTIVGNPAHFRRCLDLSALKNNTITVPSNVTRIDNDGLALCKGSLRLGGDADIMFVLDESGSMGTNRAWINTSVTPNDTLFYYSDTSCTNKSTNGTVSYTIFETVGAANPVKTTVSVSRLNSNTGCSAFSGDPYKVRATAVEQAIDNMLNSGSTISTAGFVGFAAGNRTMQSPLTLTSANVATLHNKIFIEEQGGTNYYDALNQAKSWLKNPAMIKTPKQAIVFISDGRPTQGGNSLTLVDGTMPPIYSIYLATNATPDTVILDSLSKKSGGKFFRVPPSEPDSVVKIVKQILNLILKEYQPNTALVSNNSLTPVQSATAAMPAGFVLQPDGSWLMKLNDIIALKSGTSNQISVKTNFLEAGGSSVDTQTINFTIATTDAATSSTINLPGKPFAVACFDKSTLAIQKADGTRPAYFTDAMTQYRLRVRTAPGSLDTITIPSRTALKADAESPGIKPPSLSNADSLVFDGIKPFQVLSAAKTNMNGILESSLYDSILVNWTHPRDAQDFASDFMLVRAQAKTATVWFSQTSGGAATTQYANTAGTAYIVVTDQAVDPRKTYTAIVTSESFGLDKETITLSETFAGSGILIGSLPIKQLATKNSGDGNLQVASLGDQFRVVYVDPVDILDTARSTAGFDQSVEEVASLRFTDASGTPLVPGTVWSPANGKLYFSYSDDSVSISAKQIYLTLTSKKYGTAIGSDHERIALPLTAVPSVSRATWTGSIDLAEAFPAADSNGKAEMRFRGEASIAANSHTNKGIQESNVVTDALIVAYPDSNASIAWKMDTTVASDEGLIITVNDQTYNVNQKDTALVSVACTKSGDSVSAFPAFENEVASGIYITGTLAKDESVPNLSDKRLSCLTTDQIRIRYVDPVFGTLTELLVDEVAKPVADPAGRKFVTSELVSITTATAGATIYYTLDGTTPVPGISPVYSNPIRVSVTTAIKALAVKAGFKNSKLMTQDYTKERVASRLEILDENGNSIPNGFITGAAQAVRIKLITTQDNLASTSAQANAKVSGDQESVTLASVGSLGNAFEFGSLAPLKHPFPKALGDDTIQAVGTDTLIVRWENPYDPADVAADTLVIKPAVVEAQVYFSATENGPKITQYGVGQDSVYIVVKTSPRDPALEYTVTLTSVDGGDDREVLTLTELSPGVFSAKLPVGTSFKIKDDGAIQVAAAGDQLTAVFADPVYKTEYRGDAGFARQVQESARLEFIDEAGKVIPATDVWSPAKGKIFLRYSDDWNPGISAGIQIKNARLELINRKSGDSVGADAETAVLTLKDSSSASRGIWEGSLALADAATAKNGNDTVEAYYRGELAAFVQPHDNGGLTAGGEVSDNLVIAYPDQPAEIVIRDTSGKSVDRQTDKVDVTIHDQLFTKSGTASIDATVSCAQSGDVVAQAILVWNGSAYVLTPPLDKGELTGSNPDKTDIRLLCRDTDILTVDYKDPVYLTSRSANVKWSDETVPRMYFASAVDGSVITSVSDAQTSEFLIVIEGKSPSRDQVDTISVLLSTLQGEKETYQAVETGPYTGKFAIKADYLFMSGNPAQENGKVEARIVLANRINQVLVNGSASLNGETIGASLSLLSSYNLVARAYIKDEDENGRADRAYFVFDHKLSALPGSLQEVFWNEEGTDFKRKADRSMLTFKPGSDSSVVVADFKDSQFGANLTDIAAGRPIPFGRFPDDNVFGGQKAPLEDSVGPVLVTALKHPSSLQSYSVTATEKRFFPDTLIVTVSEKIKTATDFLSLVRFSKGCADYSQSSTVQMYSPPTSSADGLTWVVIVDNSPDTQSPLVKDCLFLEADGRYSDLRDNRPARLGVELTGENPSLVIREFRGFPPVAGLDPSTPGFLIGTNDKRDGEEGTWSTSSHTNGNTWQVTWVPPYGFDADDPVGSLSEIAKDFNNPSAGERRPEVATPQPMPIGISAVQVISSGPYKAQIRIFDHLGHFVRSMDQAFGGNGEDKNPWRATNNGQVSFLVWDMKDDHKTLVGNGVYVWKVSFIFLEKAKKSEVMYTRTGVVRYK